eukprot:3682811-Prymnesium_polylepis.1
MPSVRRATCGTRCAREREGEGEKGERGEKRGNERTGEREKHRARGKATDATLRAVERGSPFLSLAHPLLLTHHLWNE